MAKGNKISKSKARRWVNNYKKKHSKDKNFMSSMLFEKEIVLKMLTEDKCKGLRIYNALDEEGGLHFVLVGTDSAGKNILPNGDEYIAKTLSDGSPEEPIIVDDGQKCPPDCPPDDL